MSKVTADHLCRAAYVYIRQSSMYQVQHNKESQRRQYALEKRAQEIGFKTVVIIDEDQGQSGRGNRREGFEKLTTAVSMGDVGMILGLEVSRFARNNTQWSRLVEICGFCNTLIADQDGIYHPMDPNDRMVLGMKGAMSELEINMLRARMQGGIEEKAKRGEMWTRIAIGYTKVGKSRIIRDPDVRVRETLATVFTKFSELGSVGKVYRWFQQGDIPFPSRVYEDDEQYIAWGPPTYPGLLSILKNPTYAGVYAYGRRKVVRVLEGDIWVTRTKTLNSPEMWDVFLEDNQEGYISYATFKCNQRQLMENNQNTSLGKGPVGEGKALLQGLMLCRRCGTRLNVRYSGKENACITYSCLPRLGKVRKDSCFSVRCGAIQEAIIAEILRVTQPYGLRAALAAEEAHGQKQRERKGLMERELEQVRYEASLARRRYERVDPDNRLVAGTVEREWNQKLAEVARLEVRLNELLVGQNDISETQRGKLHQLGGDLELLWNQQTTTSALKKKIIRCVVEEVWIDVEERHIHLDIHWHGGTVTALDVKRRQRGGKTEDRVVDIVKQLAAQMPDEKIVPILNRLGLVTGQGNPWTEPRLRSLRCKNRVSRYDPAKRTMMTLGDAARELGITTRQIRKLIDHGLIEATQVVKKAPWAVKIKNLTDQEVKSAVKSLKSEGKGAPKAPWTHTQKNLFE